jgi:two-component system, LytTR family, response regulator
MNKVNLSTSEGSIFIYPNQIVYLQAFDNYCFCHLLTHQKLLINKSLKETYKQLPSNFLRVQNGHVVNLDHVAKYVKGSDPLLIMEGNTEIPISRLKKQEVMKILNIANL